MVIKKNDADRTPDFARQSHVSGRELSKQVKSMVPLSRLSGSRFAGTSPGTWATRAVRDEHHVSIFEPMFASMQFSASLVSLGARDSSGAA